MIQGLEKFGQYFEGFEDYYTLIGGVACCLNMEEAGLDFRATKDLDIVLSAESLDKAFAEKFWGFVKEAGYEHKAKSSGEKQFYRFSRPKSDEYPFMLELFSKQPDDVFIEEKGDLTPIPVDDDVSSLSAILLDEAYYQCIKEGVELIEGVSVLSAEYIIPFKMRAYCDLANRRADGQRVDSKDVKKHRNDVLKVTQLLAPTQKVQVVEEIKEHMRGFIAAVGEEPISMKNLGINTTLTETLDVLQRVYDL